MKNKKNPRINVFNENIFYEALFILMIRHFCFDNVVSSRFNDIGIKINIFSFVILNSDVFTIALMFSKIL